MNEEHKIFSDILKSTREKIGEENFAFGFSSIELLKLQDGYLEFGVPAQFIKEFIEKNCKELNEIANTHANINEIKIVLSDQKNASDFFDIHIDDLKDITQKEEETKKKKKKESEEQAHTKQVSKNNFGLNPDFSFDNFVVGDGNIFAHSIANVISNNPGTAHNPCLYYSDVGLGKTHLLQAIGNKIALNFPKLIVKFYTSEEFFIEYVDALRNNQVNEFKNSTRKIDVLILDDIHFMSGKKKFQEEFYHIFNQLIKDEKQMIFSSDRPVHKIKDLEERLQSRFRSNMVADLNVPDPEMALGIIKNAIAKNKILKKKSESSFEISQDVLDFIIARLRFNIRDLLGVVERVIGFQDVTNTRVDLARIRQWATEYLPKVNVQKKNTIDNILGAVGEYFDVAIKDIKGNKRNRQITRIRHISMYLLKNLTRNSLTEIGKIFEVSHVAVSTAISKLEEEKDVDSELAISLDEIEEKIKLKID